MEDKLIDILKKYGEREASDKLPCSKCDRRYHFCCQKPDCWNKKAEYCVY